MNILYLPIVPIRGAVVLPSAHITFDIGRDVSKMLLIMWLRISLFLFLHRKMPIKKI